MCAATISHYTTVSLACNEKKEKKKLNIIGNERKQQQQKKPNWQWTINKYKKTKKLLATTTNVEKCVHCSAKKRREGDELL